MTNIYDYNNNIKITTEFNGDKTIKMNDAIFTVITNSIYDSAEKHRAEGLTATADDLMELWHVFADNCGNE